MSRFNFPIIAIVFACCLFTVACEKENFTPTTTEATSKFSVEDVAANTPTITNEAAEVRAAEVLAKLRAEPVIADPNTQVTVTTKEPVHPKFRHLDASPAVDRPQGNQVAELDIDCPYGDCEDKIPAMVARYQEIATAQCTDQFLSIRCCADGETVYVVIYIEAACLPAYRR